MVEPLNNWLTPTLKKARAICEDSDRKNLAMGKFVGLVERVHRLAVRGAHVAPLPILERTQDEDSVVLWVGWVDRESLWHLYFMVRRRRGEKPVAALDFYGNPTTYSCDNPSDAEIQKALYDYFEEWRNR